MRRFSGSSLVGDVILGQDWPRISADVLEAHFCGRHVGLLESELLLMRRTFCYQPMIATRSLKSQTSVLQGEQLLQRSSGEFSVSRFLSVAVFRNHASIYGLSGAFLRRTLVCS